jgi:RimJ/RimL family protein N-acetyltransferase/quercetin dioxygenase-like cupin family protein
MRIFEFSTRTMESITQYQSTGAASVVLAAGAGDARIHSLRFEPGGQIGEHPTGSAQLFLVVQGSGWVMDGAGHRVNLTAGQGAFFERREQHSKGSDAGMTALMVQVDTLECLRPDLRPEPGSRPTLESRDSEPRPAPDDQPRLECHGPELRPGPVDPPALELRTPRLHLRPFVASDAITLAGYRSDPEVARYQGWEAPYGIEQAEAFVASMARVVPGTPGAWYQLAVCLRESGEPVGDVAFRVLTDEPAQAEIGYTLARPHQGCGYATEAVRGLLDHLFGTLQLHRVRAICDLENPASARVLERLGFRREGQFRENTWFKGHWGGEYLYAILSSEWQSRGGL